jgi:hypothetical protein
MRAPSAELLALEIECRVVSREGKALATRRKIRYGPGIPLGQPQPTRKGQTLKNL